MSPEAASLRKSLRMGDVVRGGAKGGKGETKLQFLDAEPINVHLRSVSSGCWKSAKLCKCAGRIYRRRCRRESKMPTLTLYKADGASKQVEFDAAVTIGRQAAICDLITRDPKVSRRHCRIEPVAEGWRLTDLSSSNGTWVDHK